MGAGTSVQSVVWPAAVAAAGCGAGAALRADLGIPLQPFSAGHAAAEPASGCWHLCGVASRGMWRQRGAVPVQEAGCHLPGM